MQNFQALGASPPDPRASRGWGFAPRPPKQPPQLRTSGHTLPYTLQCL